MAGLLDSQPQIFLSRPDIAKAVSPAVKAGKLRKLGPKLYTKDLTTDEAALVRRNAWLIASLYFPGAVIVDRTALENVPAADGSLFLAHSRDAKVELAGLTLRVRRGAPLDSDQAFTNGLFLASTARALLENMVPSRARLGVARTLSKAELEQRLDREVRLGGPERLNRLRDEARALAPALDLQAEASALDRVIAGLLGTHDAAFDSDVAARRASGMPYEPERVDLLASLQAELLRLAPSARLDSRRPGEGTNLSFFEAYFSNYIEGTRFEVAEAEAIIFDEAPSTRPSDAHDIIGTFRVVSDDRGMGELPTSVERLHQLLRARHAAVMHGRPAMRPGEYKTRGNRAGNTVFVAPDLVLGTLAKGFELYRGLREPMQRAVFMHCLVSEVHPFADGNGRVARIMMNAELVAAGERRIIIPTVYRNNYLAALKGLSHNGLCDPIIRVLDFAQRYTQAIDFTDRPDAIAVLTATHAFVEPEDADELGVRLVMPRAADYGVPR